MSELLKFWERQARVDSGSLINYRVECFRTTTVLAGISASPETTHTPEKARLKETAEIQARPLPATEMVLRSSFMC